MHDGHLGVDHLSSGGCGENGKKNWFRRSPRKKIETEGSQRKLINQEVHQEKNGTRDTQVNQCFFAIFTTPPRPPPDD